MKILIADDHVLFREALRQVVLQLGEDITILEANDWQTLLKAGQQHSDLTLALIDLNMPGLDTFTGLELFFKSAATVPVVVVSASESVADMQRVFDAGAMGFIAKSETLPVLLSALRLVLSGGVYIPRKLIQPASISQAERNGSLLAGLTPRQMEVLKAMMQGKSNKEIASEFKLSIVTVKVHVTAIFKAMNVHHRLQAIQLAEALGLKT
jgi:DNA-binding NarL/FixJ family response regulator